MAGIARDSRSRYVVALHHDRSPTLTLSLWSKARGNSFSSELQTTDHLPATPGTSHSRRRKRKPRENTRRCRAGFRFQMMLLTFLSSLVSNFALSRSTSRREREARAMRKTSWISDVTLGASPRTTSYRLPSERTHRSLSHLARTPIARLRPAIRRKSSPRCS